MSRGWEARFVSVLIYCPCAIAECKKENSVKIAVDRFGHGEHGKRQATQER